MTRYLASLALLVFVACGPSKSQTSPGSVFLLARKAALARDYKAFLAAYDPEMSMKMVCYGVRAGWLKSKPGRDMDPAFVKLQQKHDLDLRGLALDATVQDLFDHIDRQVAQHVKDLPELYSDLCQYLDTNAQVSGWEQWRGKELSDVKISGESASGVVQIKSGPPQPISFVRRNGTWFLAFSN
jgi:hypothetical protein